MLCLYPGCVKSIQEVNERVYAVLGTHWNALYPDCLKIIQDVNERVYTVTGTYWNTRYPDCVRNIHVVNGRGYMLPGTHWNALRHCFQLVPGIFTLAVIRQVTATCPSTRVHWRHLAIELVHPPAHSSPQSKRPMDRFSRFCIAYGRKCLYFTTGAPIHQNCPFAWKIWTSHVTRDAFGPCEPTTQMAPQSVQPSLHRWPQVSLLFTMVCLFPPQKCPFPCWHLDLM